MLNSGKRNHTMLASFGWRAWEMFAVARVSGAIRRSDIRNLIQVRVAFVGLIALFGIFTISDLKAEPWSRTITLNIAADSDFRKRPDWQVEIQKTVESVSTIWEHQFGIRWKVVGFSSWEPPVEDKFLTSGKLFGHLKSTIPPSNADVVLGIFEGKCLDDYGGLSDYFGASALVISGCLRQKGSRNTIEMVLSHELAHMFGAFHVRTHIRSVMSGDGPDIFDPQTDQIIRLMRDREFAKGIGSRHDLSEDRQAVISALFSEGHSHGTRDPISSAYLVLGETFLESNRYDEAAEAFRKASQIDNSWPAPHTGMGIAYQKLGKRDLAFAAFKTALSLDPTDAQANEFLAHAKLEQGDEKGALGNFASAVKSDPRSASLRINLGLTYMGQNKPREAEDEFREALRLDPGAPDIRSNLAASLGQQRKFDEAAKVLREAIRLNPNDGKAHGNLGYTLELMGDAKGALAAYRKAQALDPSNVRNKVNLDRLSKRIRM
jgi:Tfp pilus assembly protein PilF